MTNPQLVYQTHNIMTASLDELGLMLYDRCVLLTQWAALALEENRFDRLQTFGTEAQAIFAALADSANRTTREGEMFWISQTHLWQLWQQILIAHDITALGEARALTQDFQQQLGRRTGREATP